VSVVIRKVSGAAQWTCMVMTNKDGQAKKVPCRHQAVSDTETSARVAFEAHKKEKHR
jgi:hypothetical protein